jgi:hypothetical protein
MSAPLIDVNRSRIVQINPVSMPRFASKYIVTEQQTQQLVQLQQLISNRLSEFGFADPVTAARISRHLAEISVLGQAFADHTLPLFLSLNRDNLAALSTLVASLKCDLEELSDALIDVNEDLGSLSDFVSRA